MNGVFSRDAPAGQLDLAAPATPAYRGLAPMRREIPAARASGWTIVMFGTLVGSAVANLTLRLTENVA